MFALGRAERRAVSVAAVCAFAAACALAPGQAGSSLGAPRRALASPAPAPALPADIVPTRDPFTPRIADADDEPHPAVPLRLVPLPANAGAGRFPFAGVPPALPRLLAVVHGPAPGALIDERGTARFVTVGDRIAGRRVVAIDDDGLVLDDGRRVALTRINPEVPP